MMTSAKILMATALLSGSDVSTGAVAGARMTVEEQQASQLLVATFGVEQLEARKGTIRFQLAGALGRAAMLQGFRLELSGAFRDCGELRSATATLKTRSGSTSVARFDAGIREVILPKPLGYAVDVDDTLALEMELSADGACVGAAEARVTMGYEPLDLPVSRLAVEPFTLGNGEARVAGQGRVVQQWTWTPRADGRVLALNGASSSESITLTMEDAQTGEVLWRGQLANGRHADGRAGSWFARMGAAVHAGHAYRLIAECDQAIDGAPVIMVLPVRSSAVARS